MCGKDNDGSGLDFRSLSHAYALQLPRNETLRIVHDIGPTSTGYCEYMFAREPVQSVQKTHLEANSLDHRKSYDVGQCEMGRKGLRAQVKER